MLVPPKHVEINGRSEAESDANAMFLERIGAVQAKLQGIVLTNEGIHMD
jgi:hypothetical protein